MVRTVVQFCAHGATMEGALSNLPENRQEITNYPETQVVAPDQPMPPPTKTMVNRLRTRRTGRKQRTLSPLSLLGCGAGQERRDGQPNYELHRENVSLARAEAEAARTWCFIPPRLILRKGMFRCGTEAVFAVNTRLAGRLSQFIWPDEPRWCEVPCSADMWLLCLCTKSRWHRERLGCLTNAAARPALHDASARR